MEFQILGPFEIRNDRGAVALGGVKPRAVLAVLLLHANEPVSAERLALALWGEDAPAGAVKTVQVHVSRLRKALGDGEILETTAAGYRLRVRPGELDAERFEQLVDDGRHALAAGRAEDAAALLREALALWRGSPFAELAFEPFAQAEIGRLEEQRLAALEARVEADLAAGREAELIGELQHLVAAHPTRERLAGQLMLALYRCGRQADALEAYSNARRMLVAEIGVEPGPELRRLQEAILRQDASLEPEPIAGLPRELDVAAAPPLEGRRDELASLQSQWEQARSGAGALVVLLGERGMGKSRIAAEVAGDAHAAGATVLYATGAGPAEAVLHTLARAREALRPTLLVVDDADHADADVLSALDDFARAAAAVPVLTIVGGKDAEALAGVAADGSLRLRPLDVDAVRAIAARYATGDAKDDVPAEWLLDASDGVPRRVHELASQWARREAARRVGEAAERAAAGRVELRSMEAELAGDVIDLQAAHERVALVRKVEEPVVCPFKGLASFEVADAQYFFGRERLVAELVARLVGAPLLGVVGPSGSGKSSVVRAGLLPALARGVLPDSQHWAQVLMRPGEHPLQELRSNVAGVGHQRLVLAIDQFEEAFTTCRDEAERTAFIAAVVRAAHDPHDQCVVVIAVRADYYGRCAVYPELSSLLAANHVLVRSMRPDELRRTIELPAQRAGLRVEPELTEALVADTAAEPGALPLLSTALLELWQHRRGRRLRHADYEHTGGVRGAVARLADGAFERLEGAEQTTVRRVFMRLVGEGAGGTAERRRVPLAELDTGGSEDVSRVVAMLTDQRLLTVSAGTVEVAHEALLREWPRLRGWIEDDREGLRIQRRLTAAAQEWRRVDRDDDALYRGNRLTEALEWRARSDPALSQVEREFLDASRVSGERDRAVRRRRIRLAFAALAAALAAISIVAVVAVHQGHEANRQRDIAVSRQLAGTATNELAPDPGLSLALARRAVAAAPTAEATTALRQAVLGFRELIVLRASHGRVFSADLSPDGRRAVSGSKDGKLTIWNLGDGRAVKTTQAHRGPTYAARFGPDGRWVASAGGDGEVTVTQVAGGRRRVVIPKAGRGAATLAISPDANYVASGYFDGTVRIAALKRDGHIRVLRGHRNVVDGVAFSPGARKVASASYDGTVRIWDLRRGGPAVVLHVDPGGAGGLGFSPDGRQLISGDLHGWIHFWNVATGHQQAKVRSGNRAIYAAAFSPDGQRIVSAGEDGAVRIIDVAGEHVTVVLHGHKGRVLDASFSKKGDSVISAGEDGTVRTWDPGQTRVMRGPVTGASLSSDGRRIVAGGTDGTVRIWSAVTGRLETQLRGHTRESTARFSPDGREVIGASQDGTVRIWSATSGRTEHVFHDHRGYVYAASLDPRARRLVSGGKDGRVIVRSLTGEPPVILTGHQGPIFDVGFSPTGRRVISAGDDGTIKIWEPQRSSRALTVLRGHRGAVNTAAFSADGQQVVSAGIDGTVRVWSLDEKRSVVLRGHNGAVDSASFSPTGDEVVSAGLDGSVRLWAPAGGAPLVTLHEHQGGAWTATFSPDGSRVLSAGDDGVIWLSPCEVCGSLDDVLRLARERVERRLSATEQERLVGTP